MSDEKKDTTPADLEQILVDLTLGRRVPQNDFEKKLLEEIEEIKKKDGIVDVPSNL